MSAARNQKRRPSESDRKKRSRSLEKENKALKQVHWMNFIAVTYFFAGFFLLLAFFFAATKLRLRGVVFNNS
jgi:hypothetical protein